MKTINLIAALLMAAAMPAFAENPDGAALVGKVVKIYIREANNFFIETSLVRKSAGKQYWTEVRFASPLADGRISEIVRLPDAASVERGDLVSTQLAEKRDFVRGLIPEVSRMVALVAKHDTLAAMMFDLPKPAAGAVMPYVQALQSAR
jgi:hypothetical protein